MKKWIALLLALAMVSLCGCDALDLGGRETTAPVPVETTAPEETTAPPMQMVELSAWVVADGLWADTAAVDALLAQFNAYYPNILVTVEYKTADQVASGRPDIVLANAADIARWNADGAMADLTGLWEGLDTQSAVEALCGSDGSYHTVPMCVIPYCMAVNKSMLEEAEAFQMLNSVNHTWNTSSFLRAVQNLADMGVETVAPVYCKDATEDVFTRLLVTNMYGGSFVNTRSGRYTLDSDEMVRALTALKNQAGIYFTPEMDAEAARERFLNGETAFTFNWNAALQLEHRTNEDIFYMAYPASDSRPETYAEVYGFGILDNGDATKLAASSTFVMHMSRDPEAIRAMGQLPATVDTKELYEGTELETVMTDLSKLLDYLVEGEPTAEHWSQAREEWIQLLQDLAEDTTAEELVPLSQSNLDALFGEPTEEPNS